MTRRAWILAGALALALGGAFLGGRLLAGPELPAEPEDPGAGLRVQHLVAQLLLREAGLTSKHDPLVLTPPELNVFLERHVRVARSPVWPIRVRLGPGWVEAEGPSSVGVLLDALVWEGAGTVLPDLLTRYPVWVGLRGRLRIEGGRGELVAETARIGRQPVGVDRLWRALGGKPEVIVWAMPRVVTRVEIEPGRLVIYTRPSSRGRVVPG